MGVTQAELDAHGDIELALVAAMAADPSQIDAVAAKVGKLDFMIPSHGEAFELVVAEHLAGNPVSDHVYLIDALAKAGILGSNGNQVGPRRMREAIFDSVTAHIPRYVHQIVRWAVVYEQRKIFEDAGNDLDVGGVDPGDVMEKVQARLQELGSRMGSDLSDLQEGRKKFAAQQRKDLEFGQMRGIGTTLRDLDRHVGRFVPGELIVIAARTGAGKTTLAMQMLDAVVADGRQALLVSLEMKSAELGGRSLCAEVGASQLDVRQGLCEEFVCQMESAVQSDDSTNRRLKILGSENGPVTVAKIKSQARTLMASKDGLAVVAVDYLSLIEPTGNSREPDHLRYGRVVSDLKAMAQSVEVPVILIGQLNRENTKKPEMSQLRKTGSVEETADIVLLIHASDDRSGARILIEKARGGRNGEITVDFDGHKYVDHAISTPTEDAYSADAVDIDSIPF